ncbi:MAG: 3-deoxy-manno-octulosonate cytidylyltransferase [Bacteroidetes bacterium RIFCSPLOWO2_02_FULL_36_8]|nr:MAG: 3-deoxy-manno-octulosonate cytidylyltransferase [Bacteroidetes bacterium RIFCSPLOWO2_02_FULL_36_8]OFY70440.1 MAG: 3-deoxy-manno-octulosonate cytidylyltransferase [Bacteroidetes bacterium RIFCSPLOWO2_12_FULL_37_12]
MSASSILGIIPARYNSSRFPGKPLAMIENKSMIQRVYEQAKKSKSLSEVLVATDDTRIYEHVQNFGGMVEMTSTDITNGTQRCYEAYQKLGIHYDIIINIQGDEPFIQPEQIGLLTELFFENEVTIATLCKKISKHEELINSNTVKVVRDLRDFAIYFSRSPVPYYRNKPENEWLNVHSYYKHIGIYGYRTDALARVTKLKPSPLELAESLEQMRWLENGFKIKTGETEFDSRGIDNPEDIFENLIKGK